MSEALVTFVGICTHIRSITLTPPPDALSNGDVTPGRYSRAVLVNGSLGSRIGAEGIPPHDAILYIPQQFIEEAPDSMPGLELLDPDRRTWRMKGVHLYVTNADPGMDRSDSYENVPSLTERSGRISLDLDPRVVLEGRASAVFDLFAGHLDAYRNENADDAVHVKATIPIGGANRELVVTRLWDQASSRIRLKDGHVGELVSPPNVFVMNTGIDTDKELDFLLHYDITLWSPGHGRPTPGDLSGVRLATGDERLLLGHIPSGLSIGCSNSLYP